MYTIMMNPDKHLTKTVITTLYQNENLADKLKFIIPRVYEELDLSDFQCSLVYTLPSGEEKTEELHFGSESYKDNWICGHLPIDSKITKEVGDIVLRLIFVDSDGRILRSGTTTMTISNVEDKDSNIPNRPEEDLPSHDALVEMTPEDVDAIFQK